VLPPAAALEVRRHAADHLLKSGHIDEAMAHYAEVLHAVGLEMPSSPRAALAAFLFRRAQVRVRGLAYRERAEPDVAAEDLTRIDVSWSAAMGFGLVDTILGQYFRSRCLLLALDAGEPHRVQRALAMEAAFSASDGGKAQKRTAEVLAMSRAMADQLGGPAATGWATLAESCAGVLEGRWRTAHRAAEEAEAILRDKCTGMTYEIASARSFSLWSLFYLGRLADLSRRIPARIHEAKERGDRYAVVCQSTGHAAVVWLAEDDPRAALARSREALAGWSRRTFHVEHWWAMVGERQADLYAGDAEQAHARIAEQWPDLERSLLLMVQLIRIEATHLRGRAALAVARARPSEQKALCRAAERDAAAILAEDMPWSNPLAVLLRAGVQATRGEVDAAALLLQQAASGLEAADMALYAAAARWQEGRLASGDRGQALVAASEAWMHDQGIVDPARMAAMLAPGFDA
jgi:hypothetical protein